MASYKRRVGVDASHGEKFEWELTLLAYLRCQRLHEEWKKNGKSGIKSFSVANNVDEAGNFDDVVARVEYVDNGEIKNKIMFVQCKHVMQTTDTKNKQKIFPKFLGDEKSLKAFYESFTKIQMCQKQLEHESDRSERELQNSNSQAELNEDYLKNFLTCKDLETEFLLYSNIGFSEEENLGEYKLNKTDTDITATIFNTAEVESFELQLNQSVASNKDSEEQSMQKLFREKFRIFLLQAEKLEKNIDKEIEKLLSNCDVDIRGLREYLFQEVKLQFTLSTPCHCLTEKNDLLGNITNFIELRNKGTTIIKKFKNFHAKEIFSEQSINNIKQILNSKSEQVIEIESSFQKLEKLKFLQLLCKITIDFQPFFIDVELDKEKWVSARKTNIYRKIEKVYVLFSKINIANDTDKIMNETLIQIIENGQQQISLLEYSKEFSPDTENYIQNRKVRFQGENIDIKNFYGDSWKVMLDETQICNMLENEVIEIQQIGTPLPRLDFYVTRSFKTENLNLEDYKEKIEAWNIKNDCILLFSEKDEIIPCHDASYKVFKNMEEVRTFVQPIVRADNDTYHLCSCTSRQVEWIFSFGETSSSSTGNVIGEDDLMNEIKEKISILSDVAGMGKTTTLLSLARKYKTKNPSHWVFFIELNKYMHTLKKVKEFPNKDAAIEFIASKVLNLKETEFILFSNACKVTGNAALFFDAFDEISPDAEKIFPSLLLVLEKTKIKKIFVSSRPSFAISLEEKLLRRAVKFQGLNQNEKEQALEGYWKQMLREEKKEFNNQLLSMIVHKTVNLLQRKEKFLSEILAIPLQIRMIAIVYYELLSKVNLEEFDSQKSSVNLADLYERFINLHAERFYVEKQKLLKDNIKERRIQYKLKGAEEIAFETIISDLIKNTEIDRSNEITTLCDDVGIITNKSPVVFLHRTVAEYLAAKYLVGENFCKIHCIDPEIVTNILVDQKFNIVRKFINSLLNGRTAKIFDHYHTNDLGNILHEFETTPIHVAASEGNIEIMRCLIASNNAFLNFKNTREVSALNWACYDGESEAVEFLLSHNDCLVDIRDYFDNTVLHYASERGNIEIVKLILQRNKSLLNMQNNDGNTPLHRACENGKFEAAELLLKQPDCSVTIPNHMECTALDVASNKSHDEILELLLKYGAK